MPCTLVISHDEAATVVAKVKAAAVLNMFYYGGKILDSRKLSWAGGIGSVPDKILNVQHGCSEEEQDACEGQDTREGQDAGMKH
jgi:hypothetical protein